MKLIAELTLQCQPDKLPLLIETINNHNCEVRVIEFKEERNSGGIYYCEIMYTRRDSYKDLVEWGLDAQGIVLLELRDMLGEQLKGGLISVRSRSDIQNSNDYDLKVLAPYAVALEKISAHEMDKELLSIETNIGLVTGSHTAQTEYSTEELTMYLNSERDSVFMGISVNLNGYPLLVRFAQVEDFVKTIRQFSPGFAALRITGIISTQAFDIYQQLNDENLPPVLRHELDEVPLYLFITISRALKQFASEDNNSTIGIIGIDAASLRLTRLLSGAGYGRVLGYDHNDRLVLSSENEGGMATNPENVFGNADIIILLKNHYTIDDFYRIQPGQIIYYQVDDDDIDFDVVEEKGLRGAFKIYPSRAAMLSAGLLKGMIDADIRLLNDAMLMGIAVMLEKNKYNLDSTEDMMGQVQNKIIAYCMENV